jgi:hypothetical protein
MCTSSETFNSAAGQEIQKTYMSKGGQATATAQQAIAGVSPQSVKFTVTGVPIPATIITNELLTRYGSTRPTPRLMTGIAKKESSYLQFKSRTLFGRTDLWPYESYDGGSHIGLMQMPTAMDVAWDWKVNVDKGVDLFVTKLSRARSLESSIRTTHPGIRYLNGTENENMALVLYGPNASADLGKQYYIPYCSGTVSGTQCQAVPPATTWEWRINTTGNSKGVAYVKSVRDMIVP